MTRHFLNGPNTQKKREKLKLFYYSQVFFLFNLLGLRTCVRRRDQKENGDCSSEGSNCATHVSPHVAKKQPFLPPEMLLFSSHICIKRININSNWIQVFVRYRLSYVGTQKMMAGSLEDENPPPKMMITHLGMTMRADIKRGDCCFSCYRIHSLQGVSPTFFLSRTVKIIKSNREDALCAFKMWSSNNNFLSQILLNFRFFSCGWKCH